MDLNNLQTGFVGFLPSSVISFMHLQDIFVAVLLGFFGALGAYFFKYLVSKIENFKKQN